MFENLKKVINFMNKFCTTQQLNGCENCINNNKCSASVWEDADHEIREVTREYSGEEVGIL